MTVSALKRQLTDDEYVHWLAYLEMLEEQR